MKNRVLKIMLLALVPVAMLATVGISYGLWKYSTMINESPESALYNVQFFKEGNTTTPYLTYGDLEYDSAFELPQGLSDYNGQSFIGWSKEPNGTKIAKIYNKYSELAGSTSVNPLQLFALYATN